MAKIDMYIKDGLNLYKTKNKIQEEENVKRNIKKKQRYNTNCARCNNCTKQLALWS